MANSGNTLWIVSCIKWKPTKSGIPNARFCDSRSYRSEAYARERYTAVVRSLESQGFELEEIEPNDNDVYEGVQGRYVAKHGERYSTSYVVVYIDRNPVWDPR